MSIVMVGATSGSITLQEPAVAGNTVLSLPATTGTVVVDSATQTLTNKTLTSPTLTTPNIDSAQFATVSGTAPLYACRAWVNFNGTGTVAIRASGNVSSITDLNVGSYRVNFTTAMPNTNYAVSGTVQTNCVKAGLGAMTLTCDGVSSVSYVEVSSYWSDNTYVDSPHVHVLVHR